jgi:putative peptide zinc metalloprotease protein
VQDLKKYPQLREDLKISTMVNSDDTHIVIKDPIKNTYFRFSDSEYQIIKLFTGKSTLEEMISIFNNVNDYEEIDKETIEEYWDNLNGLNLLIKSPEEMNVMLVEKVKEMRQMQLLSKKGSIMYKRFPLIDPDKMFNRVIPKIGFLWTRNFFLISSCIMLGAVAIIFLNWNAFNLGMYELFNFSTMSWTNILVLWIVIYTTIAIHELGHGLTCKYYGGEVHEIGFLLLFFQPCLYANVNDAWLFDKKWKQIMVTIAGGYIEFFIGAIFTYIWVLTNPNTFINIISFQIMSICSISTVLFNFNPLIKLDGYYLLSDLLEAPNLKEESTNYLKYLTKKYLFKMPVETFYATKKEKRAYFFYGIGTTIWMTLLLTGLIGMAKGLLVEHLHAVGMIVTIFLAYKILGGHMKSSMKFFLSFYIQNKKWFDNKKNRAIIVVSTASLITLLTLPVHYQIKGICSLTPKSFKVIRPTTDAEVVGFYKMDGDYVFANEPILILKNLSIYYEKNIASMAYQKSKQKYRKELEIGPLKLVEARNDISLKQLKLQKKERDLSALKISYPALSSKKVTLSCENDTQKIIGSFYKKGEEICRLNDISSLRAIIEVNEVDIMHLKAGNPIEFKLFSTPGQTYFGKVAKVNPTSKGDPKNPSAKIYLAEIEIENQEMLRPGMTGLAKIYGNKISLLSYLATKASSSLRLDLFY